MGSFLETYIDLLIFADEFKISFVQTDLDLGIKDQLYSKFLNTNCTMLYKKGKISLQPHTSIMHESISYFTQID